MLVYNREKVLMRVPVSFTFTSFTLFNSTHVQEGLILPFSTIGFFLKTVTKKMKQ